MANSSKKNQKKSVLKSALAMASGTMSSRILGLARDILLSALFPSRVTDAFLAAFMVPNKMRRILGEGSLSVSFIPVFIENQKKHGESAAKDLASSIWVLLTLASSLICVFAILFMDKIIPVIVSGKSFQEIPGKIELTILLGKILFSYLFLVTNYAFFMAIANAHKLFFVPAMGPTLFNFIFIIFSIMSYKLQYLQGKLLAVGVLVGGVFQFLVVFVYLFKKDLVPKFKLSFQSIGLSTVFKNMLPGILGFGVVQILSLVNIKFASSLEEGTVSYLYYADRLLELPQSIIAISLGSALLPTLSQLYSENKLTDFLKLSEKYQSILIYLAVPCAMGLYVLAEPLVLTIFQRGYIGDTQVAGIVTVLQVYSLLLLAMCMNKVLIPNLYAIKNTWLPAVITIFTLLVHIVMAPMWMEKMGLRGLIISTTIAGFLNMFCIFIACQLIVGRTSLKQVIISFTKSSFLALIMGGALFAVLPYLPFGEFGQLLRVVSLLALVIFGITIYIGLSYLFKYKEFDQVKKLIF